MALMTCRGKVDCWCTTCHQGRFDRIKDLNLSLPRLLVKFESHEDRESKTLERVFSEVLNATVYASLLKDKIFQTTGFRKTKTYLSFTFPNHPDKELQTLADSINHAALVYRDIGRVFANLQQIREKVDIRRLSLKNLFEARDIKWCYSYAERMRGRKRRKPDELEYAEADFENLVNMNAEHPCFQAVADDRSLVASLSHRLEQHLLKRVRR